MTKEQFLNASIHFGDYSDIFCVGNTLYLPVSLYYYYKKNYIRFMVCLFKKINNIEIVNAIETTQNNNILRLV